MFIFCIHACVHVPILFLLLIELRSMNIIHVHYSIGLYMYNVYIHVVYIHMDANPEWYVNYDDPRGCALH